MGAKPNVRMCLYGMPGSGKTRLIASGQRTLIIRPPTDHTDSVDFKTSTQEIEVSDHNELLEVYQWCQQGKGADYDWVWLDSITLFEEFGLDDVFDDAIVRNPHRKEHGPDKGEYGINRGRISKHVRDMVGLSSQGMFNYGVTANVMEIRDPVKDEEFWGPQFGSLKTGTLSLKLCGYMNVVAYLRHGTDTDRNKRVLLADADGFIGKDQYNCFPKLKSGRHGFINPTMKDLAAVLPEPARAKAARKRPASKTTRKRTPRKRS